MVDVHVTVIAQVVDAKDTRPFLSPAGLPQLKGN